MFFERQESCVVCSFFKEETIKNICFQLFCMNMRIRSLCMSMRLRREDSCLLLNHRKKMTPPGEAAVWLPLVHIMIGNMKTLTVLFMVFLPNTFKSILMSFVTALIGGSGNSNFNYVCSTHALLMYQFGLLSFIHSHFIKNVCQINIFTFLVPGFREPGQQGT